MAKYTTEKQHYESLTTFLKWAVSSALIAISIITGTAAYMFGENLKEMKEEFRNEFNEKKDAVEANLEKQNKDLEKRKGEMDAELQRIETKAEKQISETQKNALNEIEKIKITAVIIAKDEAKKKIYEVFNKNNLESTVMKVAEEVITPKVNESVDRQIIVNQNKLVEECITNLSSGNNIKIAKSLNYLQVNPEIVISENQSQRIVDAIPNINPSYRLSVMMLLVYRESEASTKLFKETIVGNDNTSASFAIQYFILNDVEYSIFEKSMISLIKKYPEHSDRYFQAVELASNNNKNYAFNLLNSRNLVNELSTGKEKEYFSPRKENLKNNLKNNGWEDGEINRTYLYQKN